MRGEPSGQGQSRAWAWRAHDGGELGWVVCVDMGGVWFDPHIHSSCPSSIIQGGAEAGACVKRVSQSESRTRAMRDTRRPGMRVTCSTK